MSDLTAPHDCPWLCAIDFGFDSTVVAVRSAPTGPVVVTRDETAAVPSAVYAVSADEILTGEIARAELRRRPSAGFLSPKHLVSQGGGGGAIPETTGGGNGLVPTSELVAAVLRPAFAAATSMFAGPPDAVILTHPAGWAAESTQASALRSGAIAAGIPADLIELVAEPMAVASHVDRIAQLGERLAILDIGAGTIDLAVTERTPDGLSVIGEPVSAQHGVHIADRHLEEHLLALIEEANDGAGETIRAVFGERAGSGELPERLGPIAAVEWRNLASDIVERVSRLKEDESGASASLTFARPLGMSLRIEALEIDRALDTTLDAAAQLLQSTVGDVADIDTIVVSGAAARNPRVVARLTALLDGSDVVPAQQPKEAVALGALFVNRSEAFRLSLTSVDGRAVGERIFGPVVDCEALGTAPTAADRVRWRQITHMVTAPFGAYVVSDQRVLAFHESEGTVCLIAGGGSHEPGTSALHPHEIRFDSILRLHPSPSGPAVVDSGGSWWLGPVCSRADLEDDQPERATVDQFVDENGRLHIPQPFDPDQLVDDLLLTAACRLPSGRYLCASGDRLVIAGPQRQVELSSNTRGSSPSSLMTGPYVSTLAGHADWVRTLEALDDGLLASGSGDRTIRIWDLATGQIVTILTGHTGSVFSAARLGGGLLASGSSDETVRIWDLATGQVITILTGHTGAVRSVASLGDGLLASASEDQTIMIWDIATGRATTTLTGHARTVWSVTSLGNGLLASASGDQTIMIWDIATGRATTTLTGHSDTVYTTAWLGDGLLASGSGDHTIRIWDIATGRTTTTLTGHTGSVWSVAWLSEGVLASGSTDETVRIWDLASGRTTTLTGHTDTVWSIASLGSGLLASSSIDDDTIRIWDLAEEGR